MFIIIDTHLTSDEVKKLRKELKQFYRNIFAEIKTSPLDHKSEKKLEQIYVNLILIKDIDKKRNPIDTSRDVSDADAENFETFSLMSDSTYESTGTDSSSSDDVNTARKHIDYSQIFEILKDEHGKSRMAFLGDAGVGKTTLLVKIAYDWAMGHHLSEIELLFFVPLRAIQTCAHIGDITKACIPRTFPIKSRKVDNYIRANQRKVMFLLDGLDEYHGDIKEANPVDVLIGVMRGDDLQKAPVLVTTRPWRAEQITSIKHINKRYTRVVVEGFKKDDVKVYINKFFEDDSQSSDSLIHLMTEDSLVAETMAPYPIFCCMLCHIWTEKSRREAILKLQTFSQLFDEMIDSLTEQWLSKEIFKNHRKCALDNLRQIGKIAYEGLLTKQLIFTKKEFTKSPDSMHIGCEIGVLSSEKGFKVQQAEKNPEHSNVSFPHKLFQEYLSGLYLASIYDVDPAQFADILKDTILSNYKEFRYVLYFTAAHGKRLGNAGKALMESLCTEVKDDAFIVDVAFEFHDDDAIAPVIELFNQKQEVKLYSDDAPGYIDLSSKHTRSACMYTWAVCCRNLVNFDVLNGFYIDYCCYRNVIYLLIDSFNHTLMINILILYNMKFAI